MAVKLKDQANQANQDALFEKISAEPREKKSKAAPAGTKTVLLYLPEDVHVNLKMFAAGTRQTINSYIIEALKESFK